MLAYDKITIFFHEVDLIATRLAQFVRLGSINMQSLKVINKVLPLFQVVRPSCDSDHHVEMVFLVSLSGHYIILLKLATQAYIKFQVALFNMQITWGMAKRPLNTGCAE